MPFRVLKVNFGDLKIGAKFLAKIPNMKRRKTLIKKWSTSAVLEKNPVLMYSFKDTDAVLVYRWSPY